MNITKKEYNRQKYLKNRGENIRKSKERYQNNKEHCIKVQKAYDSKHREELQEYAKNWRLKNPEYYRKYSTENKEKLSKKRVEYDSKNREHRNKVSRKFYLIKENIESRKKWVNQYRLKHRERLNKNTRLKRINDPNFRMRGCLYGRVRDALKHNYKSAHTMELIGCTIPELWIHLESKFKPLMTRENHGLWHLDHIKPCFKFDLTDPAQQRECFNWSNLQPLWAVDNLRKGYKYEKNKI